MQLIFKAVNVKQPGKRGAPYWIDEHGKVRYGVRPFSVKPKRSQWDIYIAQLRMSDGTIKTIRPKPDEVDEHGQVIGGQKKVREIVNRELFGEYGFKKDGTFWQKRGLLVSYVTRTTPAGKVVVDQVPLHEGFVSWEFRDSSVARAYGGDVEQAKLPNKIEKYRTEVKGIDPTTGETEGLPTKPDPNDPDPEGTSDQPVDALGIHNHKPLTEESRVALRAPLKQEESPLDLAHAYLEVFLSGRRSSSAKTPEGQAKARAERKGRLDEIAGARKITNVEDLPAWIVNKYDSPEELQHELGRSNDLTWLESGKVKGKLQTQVRRSPGGRPLTTLITFGLWNPKGYSKRHVDQLLKEWRPFLRKWARVNARVYAETETYRQFSGGVDKAEYMRDRERDLYQSGVAALIEAANSYVPNTEIGTINSRFDRFAKNEIKNTMKRISREHAIELGAVAIEDLSEEDSYRSPKFISPKEHFQLHHYETRAREILKDIMGELTEKERAVFEAHLWMDDTTDDPEASQERKHNEARERQREKAGRSATHWGRPWTTRKEGGANVQTMAEKFGNWEVRVGTRMTKIKDMKPDMQRYHLQRIFEDAKAKIDEHLKSPGGDLTSKGKVVHKWLMLEAKLGDHVRREIANRSDTSVKVPLDVKKAFDLPSSFGSIGRLAKAFGIVADLQFPPVLKSFKQSYTRLHANLQHIQDTGANLTPLRDEQETLAKSQMRLGRWEQDDHGNQTWHEECGVQSLHDAAMRIHANVNDTQAIDLFDQAAKSMGAHPMVSEYKHDFLLHGIKKPSLAQLAEWKSYQHQQTCDAQNRLSVIEFVMEDARAVIPGDTLYKAMAQAEVFA